MADENTGHQDVGALQYGGDAANRGAADVGALQTAEDGGAPPAGQPMMLRATTVPGMRQWHPRFCA